MYTNNSPKVVENSHFLCSFKPNTLRVFGSHTIVLVLAIKGCNRHQKGQMVQLNVWSMSISAYHSICQCDRLPTSVKSEAVTGMNC